MARAPKAGSRWRLAGTEFTYLVEHAAFLAHKPDDGWDDVVVVIRGAAGLPLGYPLKAFLAEFEHIG